MRCVHGVRIDKPCPDCEYEEDCRQRGVKPENRCMSVAKKVLDGIAFPGYGLRAAWLMGRASYAYTRSYDGTDIGYDEATGKRIVLRFGRWYAFVEAVQCGARYLRSSDRSKS